MDSAPARQFSDTVGYQNLVLEAVGATGSRMLFMKTSINSAVNGKALLSLITGLGAIGVSSCCALPLALSAAGLSSAWLSRLSELAPYEPYFLGVAAVALAVGWIMALRRRAACTTSDTCLNPARNQLTYSVLGLSTLMAGTAAAWDAGKPKLPS